jgi:2,5-diketo-D-gluconate reductase A
MSTVPMITLNDQVQIPQIGFGVFQIDPDETTEAVLGAFEVGYRHIDTAQMYGNEAEVGEAIERSGLDRGEIFVTSKLDNGNHGYHDAIATFDETLERLGGEYVDLFLIHWPMPESTDFVKTWQALEEIAQRGDVRSIGVSNFQPEHLQRIVDETGTVPSVNQIEVHPYFAQKDVRAFNAEHGIATEAWSPIAQGDVLDEPVLTDIGDAHGKTSAQVTLRWHIQRGDIVFPKTVTPDRMRENFEIFDFELDDAEMRRIDGLDRADGRRGPHPNDMN